MRALKSVNDVSLSLSQWLKCFQSAPLVLHGSSGKQVVFPFQTDQHHQCPNPHSGKLYDSFLCVSGVGIYSIVPELTERVITLAHEQ